MNTSCQVSVCIRLLQTKDYIPFLAVGYGQRHKTFQNIVRTAREQEFLLSTKARYGGEFQLSFNCGIHCPETISYV